MTVHNKITDVTVLFEKAKMAVLSILIIAWKEKLTIDKTTRDIWISKKPNNVPRRDVEDRFGGYGNVKNKIIERTKKQKLDDLDFYKIAEEVADELMKETKGESKRKKKEKKKEKKVVDENLEYKYNISLFNKDAIITNLKRNNRKLINELTYTQNVISNYNLMIERPAVNVNPIFLSNKGKRESSAMLLLSDWHVGDSVKPERVTFRNEFNKDICVRRAMHMCTGFHYTLQMLRHNYHIDELVIGIMGDMISGWIHDEQIRNNTMTPPEEVLFATDLLDDVIKKIIYDENGNLAFPKVRIVCTTGNHGRNTKKIFHSDRARTNFEWTLYHTLKHRVENGKNITFNISDGEFAYENVCGMDIRFTHGDGFNYRNGVGGISVPLLRKLPRWDSVRKAQLTCMGHWHQHLNIFNAGVIINSSLVGYNEFAMHYGFMCEEPSQTLVLVDAKKKMPWVKQLWLDKKAA
jgi:hypothetical protein